MRVVMLTDDVQIDRRILLEAESLVDVGHEVIVLAGWSEGLPEFERVGRVKVERLRSLHLPWRLKVIDFAGVKAQRVIDRVSRAGLRPARVWQGLLALGARAIHGAVNRAWRMAYARGVSPLDVTVQDRLSFYRPDVIHAHDLPKLPSAIAAKRRLAVPVVYDAHELYPEQAALTPRQAAAFARTERRHIEFADRVVTVNELLAREMAARYGRIPITVIQNAVDPPPGFDPSRRYDRFREEHGCAAEELLVLYQGWMAPGRNLDVAVKGMRLVSDPRFVLLLMGYGDYAKELEALARREGVGGRVRVIPSKAQDELLFYTASADIGLVPYPPERDLNTRYCSPNKLYEFVVAGLPFLTNDLQLVREAVERYGFGVCAGFQDPQGFAAALNGFPLERLAEYRANLRTHRWRFEWSGEAKHLLKLYAELAPACSRATA